MNIILVGFMGTGKTAVARALARKLKMKYVDLDDVIEADAGRSINKIFAESGEDHFRYLEKEAARKVSSLDQQVVATGGGVVLDKQNMKNLSKNGVVVCLTATAAVIYSRVKDQSHRPLLKVDKPQEAIKRLLDIRQPYYARADFTIDTSEMTAEETVSKIVKMLNYANKRRV